MNGKGDKQQIIKESKMSQIKLAEQQIIGFAHASKGYSVKDLAESMGLTKKEWIKLREKEYLRPVDNDILDEMFKLNQST